MGFLGLHPLDWAVLVVYVLGMVAIARWARRRIRTTSDFYQGNRSFGRSLIAFLNFGNMTDAGQTASVTREIYRQGFSGIWFQGLVLFHTPFQWFIAALQRRARYIGPADIYLHRFESRTLAAIYAGVIMVIAVYANATGYMLTGRTLEAMMQKPAVEYTVSERAQVEGYREFSALEAIPVAQRTPAQAEQYADLALLHDRQEIRPFISYLNLTIFYMGYAVVIMAYTAIGGLFAIALIDIIQGLLIVFLSLALIPAALASIGGLEGLRQKVDPSYFNLFGSSPTSDYTWYFVAAFALMNLVVNAPKSFTLGGAARDDRSARIGFVTGSISKRFMMVAWAFTGLLAVGLYSGKVDDPTNIWGFMTSDLLGAGALGLMIAAIFSANMDGSATISLDASAAFTKNIYLPFAPRSSERRQMFLGRGMLILILGLSVPLAALVDYVNDIFVVFTYVLSIGTVVGPSIWLAYFWRRLTTRAVIIQMTISILITIILPNIVPLFGSNVNPEMTNERVVMVAAAATRADVDADRATAVGQEITRREVIAPTPIFYESVETDANGVVSGSAPFRTQIWILDALGIDFSSWSRSAIKSVGFLFDAIVPFLILFVASLFTRRNSESILRDFYARIHTPAVADPQLDAQLVQQKIDNPELVERDKIFAGTDWEFWRPTRFDILGFLACIGFVVVVVGLYMLVAGIGGI